MTSRVFGTIALLILAAGCRFPWEPRGGYVMGSVRYPDGDVGFPVRVRIEGAGQTTTDRLGRYELELPVDGDSVTIVAWDGVFSSNGTIHEGALRIAVHGTTHAPPLTLDIVDNL